MPGAYSITTRVDGETVTAAKYNADHQSHIDHLEPAYIDDYSTNLSQMRSQTDPGESGSESPATTHAGELERIRARLAEIAGMTYWYQTGTGIRAQSFAGAGLPTAATAGRLAYQNDGARGLKLDTGSAWVATANTFNVRNWGATGDGVTNDATNVQAAITAVIANGGGTLYFPKGTYLVGTNLTIPAGHNVYLVGDGEASVIKATTGVNAAIGVVAFGLNAGFGSAPCTSIGASHLKFDGNNICRALYVHTCTRGLFTHVWTGNSTAGAFQCYSSTDITLAYSHIENGNGEFGDGVYCESCTRPKILYNYVYDFERLGIVMEGAPGANTFDALIQGNNIEYGHNSTGVEANGGVWVENCERAHILDNTIANVTNTPANPSRGITLGGTTPVGVPDYFVTNNRITGAQLGIVVSPGSTARVLVDNNILTGTNTLIGVYVATAQVITISNCYFVSMVHTAGSHGAIVIDGTSAISRMDVKDCVVTNTTYSGDSADFNIYALTGGSLSHLKISGLYQWRCTMRSAPVVTDISDSYLYGNTTNYWCAGATTYFNASNCFFTDTGSAGVRMIGSTAASGIYTLSNCTLTNCYTQLATATNIIMKFVGCSFYGSQFQVNGHGELDYTGCLVNEYPSTGFIRANFDTGKTLHIRFKSGEIRSTNDYTPFGLWNYHPTTLIIQDTVRSSLITTLTSMTAASTGFTVTNVVP